MGNKKRKKTIRERGVPFETIKKLTGRQAKKIQKKFF